MTRSNILKIPPHDLEAELSVLGSIMLDKDAILKVVDILTANDFYSPANQKIYKTIVELFEKGQPIDLLTVTTKLKEKNELASIGDASYLTEIIESVPSAAHVAHYAQIVREKRVRRDFIHASGEMHENAFGEEDFENLIDNIEKKVFAISQLSKPQKFAHVKEELVGAYERFERLHRGDGALRGVPTGFSGLDNILSGLQKSDLILLGARPSFGKTSLALDIVRQAAFKGSCVGVFSLEMSREQIVDRLIASQANIPLWRLRTGRLRDELEFELVRNALDELARVQIFIDDTPSPNILQMRSMTRRLQIEHGIDLLIIDYLQLIQPRASNESTVHQVTEISRGLKSIARELNIPVLALSQLSRAVDQRDVKIPRLSDLRESGSLEQDSDIVLFLYRKDRDKLDTPEEERNMVEVIIAKHRNGPLGTVKLRFDQESVSFRNIDTAHSTTEE